MSLVTPEFGLLFWMVLIFGIVFFLLAKFGFPVISKSIEERNAKIEQSLKDADALEARMEAWKTEQARMMEQARREQSAILKEAAEAKTKMLSQAREEAREEASRILSEAKTQIEAEKESALRDVRREIALLSVDVAQKILRQELSDTGSQRAFIDKLVDEAAEAKIRS